MFWNHKRKMKEKREAEYLELNSQFQEKHNVVARWYMNKYLLKGLQPISDEGFEYQRRMKNFFGTKYGELPKSFNAFANVNYGFDKDFDHNPVEKLLKLYSEIEIVFPEPFVSINRHCKINELI